MPAFKTADGREWLIRLDAPLIKEVRSSCNVDLAAPEGPTFGKMIDDPCTLVDVLWILVRSQAAGITDQAFAGSLVGDSLDGASRALLQAIADFSPARKRAILEAMIQRGERVQTRQREMVVAKLADQDLDKRELEAMEAAIDQSINDTLTRLRGVSSTPASAELAPTVSLWQT